MRLGGLFDMTPKRRFEAALNFKEPDDFVAFMEIEFHIYEEFTGKAPVTGYEFEKLSSGEKEKALYTNAEILVETAEKAGHDAIRSIAGYWEVAPGVPTALWLPGKQDQLKQIKALKDISGDKYYIIGSVASNLGMPTDNSFYEFVTDLYENPDKIKEQNEKMLKEAIEWQYRQIEAGADSVVNCVDVAFNSGPFISPQQMDEFFFPYFNRWVESLKSQGIISIWHTDGNILPIMDRVLESGVTAIQCLDPLAGIDIVELKKKVDKKLTLIGNIDCSLLQFGPEEKIEEEVKRVVEVCKENGGFVLSGCNAIFHGIPAENYKVMVKSRFKYGHYRR